MAQQKKQQVFVRTETGTAAFSYVHKPDTEGKFADGKFKLTIVLDADPEEVRKGALKVAADEYPKMKPEKVNVLIVDGDDKTDAEGNPKEEFAGKFLITAKTKFAPQIVGPDRKPLPAGVEIRSGDQVKALLVPIKSDMPIKGSIAFRLAGVQLIEKRAGGGHDYSSMFDDEGEGFGSAAPDGATADVPDEELPF